MTARKPFVWCENLSCDWLQHNKHSRHILDVHGNIISAVTFCIKTKQGRKNDRQTTVFFNFRPVLSFYLEFKIKFILPCHSSNIFKLHFVLFLVFWGVVSHNQAASSSAFFSLRKRVNEFRIL